MFPESHASAYWHGWLSMKCVHFRKLSPIFGVFIFGHSGLVSLVFGFLASGALFSSSSRFLFFVSWSPGGFVDVTSWLGNLFLGVFVGFFVSVGSSGFGSSGFSSSFFDVVVLTFFFFGDSFFGAYFYYRGLGRCHAN